VRHKTLALPLRCVDFSDSSQVVSLFTREQGLVDAIAKGAHREKNPFQGPFDLAVEYEVVFLERRSAGLALLTDGVVVDGLRGLHRRWERHVAASHVLEFLRAVAIQGEPEPGLFDLSIALLRQLTAASGSWIEALLARFDTLALRLLGLLGEMDACVECGRRRPEDQRPVFISPRARGVVCRSCRESGGHAGGFALPGAAMRLLDRLAFPGDLERAGVEESWKTFGPPLRRLVSELRTSVLERDLVALRAGRWV
jgi:DNA repair protein RecO (recombination protein O)